MAKMTLTEALATYKLTLKKMQDKTRELGNYTVRDARIVDPLLKSGSSSPAFVSSGIQSIADLGGYAMKLKRAIAHANETTFLFLMGEEVSIADAIVWRRDVAPIVGGLFGGMLNQARNVRTTSKKGDEQVTYEINFDEADAMKMYNTVQEEIDKLDTRLSILNATTMVEI